MEIYSNCKEENTHTKQKQNNTQGLQHKIQNSKNRKAMNKCKCHCGYGECKI